MKKNVKNSKSFQLLIEGRVAIDNKGNEVKYPPVYVTYAYELLELLKGVNRPVCPAHSARLGESVVRFGNLRDVIIVKIRRNYYIADGQNLERFIENAGLPVQFKLVEADSPEEALKLIAVLNSTSRSWGLKQYVDGWANFNEDYATLKMMKKEYAMTYTTIAMLLSKLSKQVVLSKIKKGEFETVNIDDAKKALATIDNFYNAMSETGLIRYSYTTAGLVEFINIIGQENYYANERKILRNAVALNKISKTRTFARVEDVVEFLHEAYCGKRSRLIG